MRKVAFLMLAKGNSKRLPFKNKIFFAGKCLFEWNLQKVLKITKNVYFNSDDDEMIKTARNMKANIIDREENLRDHDIPSRVLFISSLRQMPKNIDAILSIQANSPNLDPKIIIKCYKLMQNNDFDELLTFDSNFKLYGSLWGISRKRLISSSTNTKINDKKTQKPDCLVLDNSIDIHTFSEYKKALKTFKKTRQY